MYNLYLHLPCILLHQHRHLLTANEMNLMQINLVSAIYIANLMTSAPPEIEAMAKYMTEKDHRIGEGGSAEEVVDMQDEVGVLGEITTIGMAAHQSDIEAGPEVLQDLVGEVEVEISALTVLHVVRH